MKNEDNIRGTSVFRKMLRLLAVLCAVLSCVDALPNGAPASACASLTPRHHGIEPQRGRSNYEVAARRTAADKVTVTISSTIGEEFSGFMLQARSARDPRRLVDGTFAAQNGDVAKTLGCSNGRENTLTHTEAAPKRSITAEWTPTGNVDEEVIFKATVAKTFAVFFLDVDSAPVLVKSSGGASSSSSSQNQQGNGLKYDDCFTSKGCFGLPADCISEGNCKVLASYVNTGNGVSFSLSGPLKTSTYMAMAFSRDSLMGDDYVTSCALTSSTDIEIQESYNNQRKQNRGIRELQRERSGSFENGVASCTFVHPYLAEAPNGDSFDLQNQTYFLLLAEGPYDDQNGRIGYHATKESSAQRVNFTSFESISGLGATDAVKVHGTFMITSWIGLASLAMLLARHFKSAFQEKQVCGVKVWFALHRSFLVSALILIIIALITIFIHKNGWNYETSNPHAIFGIVSSVLACLQPIMAAFRPSPDHSKRPIFNWAHFLVGNSAYILAIIAMFFAKSLDSSKLRGSFYYALSIFVVGHVLFHALFQILSMRAGKQNTNDVKMRDMAQPRSNAMQNEMSSEKNNQAEIWRILLLGLYSIFVVIILVTMYSLIAVA